MPNRNPYDEGVEQGVANLPAGLPGDMLAPFLIAGLGAGRAGEEIMRGVEPVRGIVEAQFTGQPYDLLGQAGAAEPASLKNVLAFLRGLTEGAVYQRPRK